MQFRTVRQPKSDSERLARQAGPRAVFFAFDYELSHDPAIEGVGVQLAAGIWNYASWDYQSEICTGARVGWEGAQHDDGVRLCCTRLSIQRTRDNPVDTSPAAIRSVLFQCVRNRVAAWAEPIPPLRPEWLTSDVTALARGIHANAAFDGLPALTDALIEAGCDDPLVMEHLKTCPDHAPSCWVVEMILDQLGTAK
jgi:hypothetical protein